MYPRLFAAVVILLGGCVSVPAPELTGARQNEEVTPVHYTNARWYKALESGIIFERGDRYTRNGVFVSEKPEGAQTVDLGGRFVVPPFGEAHNHSVDGPGSEAAAATYVSQGIFYYKNPNGIFAFTEPMLPHWRRADTLDVSFSYGGLSVDEGHPEKLYRMLLGWGLYRGTEVEALDGAAFYDISTVEMLEEKWPQILANKPDFLKLYLLNHDTEESAGLGAVEFREVVRRAQAAGLRTSVHIETAQDLALAVDAGATEAAHLPAYAIAEAGDERLSRIPDELIERMGNTGFIVVTTVNVSQGRDYDEETLKVVTDRQADNLSRMRAAGVGIAIGSDSWGQTSLNEIRTLRSLGVFSDEELLKLWVETPALSIFPGRAIGRLAPGYEASFLALDCNPVLDIECTQAIHLGIKQGATLVDAGEAP